MSNHPADQGSYIVLSHFQIRDFFSTLSQSIPKISYDLGLSTVPVSINSESLKLPDGSALQFDTLREMMADERYCYLVEDGNVKKLMFYSDSKSSVYKMIPTEDAPALEISGILMHRIKNTTPWEDAKAKIRFLQPEGSVLDTNCGFGYTAIQASEQGCNVTTVEIDTNVLELARYNPWSKKLFERSSQIKLLQGDIFELINEFDTAQFDSVIHDPPTLGRAESLYSLEFYQKLKRVLKPGGKLFHYIGAPGSRARGINLMSNVKSKLRKTGFNKIQTDPELASLIAIRN
ncbi:MAG: methyltransferase domain-containing protein [Thermoplasmata archaeon]|nr:MAG: methyltransferase domain-containing protein [Thermoplasmata archaeon]